MHRFFGIQQCALSGDHLVLRANAKLISDGCLLFFLLYSHEYESDFKPSDAVPPILILCYTLLNLAQAEQLNLFHATCSMTAAVAPLDPSLSLESWHSRKQATSDSCFDLSSIQ